MTPRETRIVTLGALVLGLIVTITRGLPLFAGAVVMAWKDVTLRVELLSRMREQVASGPRLTDSAAELRSRLNGLAPAILTSDGGAEALEELNARMARFARAAGAQVRRAIPLGDSVKAGVLRRVSLRVDLECDLAALLGMLRKVSQDAAAIATNAVRIVATNPSSAHSVPEVLNIELHISAWYLEQGHRHDSATTGVRFR